MDLIFNENLIMLISVYIPILYTMIVMLEDKKAETMIEKMIAAHKMGKRSHAIPTLNRKTWKNVELEQV